MQACLSIAAGKGSPNFFRMRPESPVTLGRHRKNVIVLHDEHASRWHAEISFENGRWIIRDKTALNPTQINGTPITEPTPLSDGQVISIGKTMLRFVMEPSDSPRLAALLRGEREPTPLPSPVAINDTVLCHDELSVLCQFMAYSIRESDPRALLQRALEVLHRHVAATVTGFLSLDADAPVSLMAIPRDTQVDSLLSRRLVQAVQKDGHTAWLAQQASLAANADSLKDYSDALCIPLAGAAGPVGAVHVYVKQRFLSERSVRFCEVLCGHLASSLQVLRARRILEAENSRLRSHAPADDELVGESAAMVALRQRIARLAPGRSLVLIVGESGSGKELVALALHRQSLRHEGPLVIVNCAAIVPTLLESELFGHRKGAFSGADFDRTGYFKQADEGTLFLDEIGDLSLDCQAKLLRVLDGKGFRPIGAEEEEHADVRILAATHKDLASEVEAGRFRHDLYYRLQGMQIQVPPLREHLTDIPALVEYFLDRLCAEWGRNCKVGEKAMVRLLAYSWPGNVRQLRSVLENAVALCTRDEIRPDDLLLPLGPEKQQLATLNLMDLESLAIREAIETTKGNVTRAAQLLGVGRDTLRDKIKRHQLTFRFSCED